MHHKLSLQEQGNIWQWGKRPVKNNSGQLRRQLEICNKSSRFLHVLVSLEKILVLENPGKVQENGMWLSWIFLRKVCSWKQQVKVFFSWVRVYLIINVTHLPVLVLLSYSIYVVRYCLQYCKTVARANNPRKSWNSLFFSCDKSSKNSIEMSVQTVWLLFLLLLLLLLYLTVVCRYGRYCRPVYYGHPSVYGWCNKKQNICTECWAVCKHKNKQLKSYEIWM